MEFIYTYSEGVGRRESWLVAFAFGVKEFLNWVAAGDNTYIRWHNGYIEKLK